MGKTGKLNVFATISHFISKRSSLAQNRRVLIIMKLSLDLLKVGAD